MVQHFGLNTIELAQYYPDNKQTGISSNVIQLAQDFNQAGIDTKTLPHLATVRWMKLAANIPANGLSVVLNASNQALARDPASYELLCAITREVIAVAKQCDAYLPEDFYQFRLDILEWFKKSEPPFYSSMKMDYDNKQPLELHAIYENALLIAQANHVSMPLTSMLYKQLLFLNARNLL